MQNSDYNNTSQLLTELKNNPDYVWLKAVDSMALQESVKNLDNAFQNFFKHRGDYPRFKSKHNHNQSYRTRNQTNIIRFDANKLKLPKLGIVKIKQSRKFEGRILNATISRTASGKYFVSLCVEQDIENLLKRNAGGNVGILPKYIVYTVGHTEIYAWGERVRRNSYG